MVYYQTEQFDSGWKRHIDASNIGLALFSLTAGFFICFLLKTNAWTRETDNIFDNTLIINDCFSMTFWTDWTKWKTPKTQVFRCFLRIYGFFRQSHFCLSYPTCHPFESDPICERTLGACMPGLSVQMPSGYQPFEILHKNDYDGFAFSYSTKICKIRRIEAWKICKYRLIYTWILCILIVIWNDFLLTIIS